MGSNNGVTVTYSNVDVVNPLLNGCLTGQLHAVFRYYHRSMLQDAAARSRNPNFNHNPPLNKMLLRTELLRGVICTTASLGIFEILTQRLRNVNNNGRPLSLYQEACCGLICGTTAVFVWEPFVLAFSKVGPNNLTYINWFTSMTRIVRNERASIWLGSRSHSVTMCTNIAAYAGMLASYDRSKTYLIETRGLSKSNAQLSASIISGFFSAACAHPIVYVGAIMGALKEVRGDAGGKRVYRAIPAIICSILTPNSNFNFYSRFLKSFPGVVGYTMVQYSIYEFIRGVDWSK